MATRRRATAITASSGTSDGGEVLSQRTLNRSRIMAPNRRVPLLPDNGAVSGTVLVDGLFEATWQIKRQDDGAVLHITPFAPLSTPNQAALAEEGARLLAFAAADASTHDVRFTSVE